MTGAVGSESPVELPPRQLLIDGGWVDAAAGATLESVDPATGQTWTSFACGDEVDVDRAVTAASAAFTRHELTPPSERSRWLFRLADLIEEHADWLALVTTRDMGMPVVGARAQAVAAAEQCRYIAGWATKIEGSVVYPSAPGEYHAYVDRRPLGVVAAIVPWNAPILLTMLKLAPALATGNAIVIKPSEEASLSLLALGKLVVEAGVPDGLVNIVTGLGPTAGSALASHPGVAKVTVTGSVETGRKIVQLAGQTLKRVTLELGGKSPNIVCADADLDIAVPESGLGVFAFSGQLCVAGTRILVHRSRYEEFAERLGAYAAALTVGPGIEPETQIGPLVNQRQLERARGYVERAAAANFRRVESGGRAHLDSAPGFYLEPQVFADVPNDSELGREEVFGPVASLMPFDDVEEAVRIANDTPFGLAAGIYSNDINVVHRAVRRLRAGVVWVNGYLASDPAMPFGGTKLSGYGREKGHDVLHEYTETTAVWVKIR